MESYYEQAAALERSATPFVAITLVVAEGSTPQDAGAKALVTADGLVAGTVGGGRVEARAIREAQALLAVADPPQPRTRLVHWNLKTDIGMTCGGVVTLYFERVDAATWDIVLFGAGHVVQALVPVLLPLPCRITCVDPRAEWLARLPASPRLLTVCTPDPSAEVPRVTARSFALCLTMGHATDRPILAAILQRPFQPAFLGVIGSASKRAVLCRELREQGLPEERLTFHCPVGLPIGSNHPQEIAISIAAQLLAERDRLAGPAPSA